MMITPGYCLTMARYNAWQNKQLIAAFETLAPAALTEDRGAFFGSLLATANHLLWGDRLWLSRFRSRPLGAPDAGPPDGTALTPSREIWAVERFKTDGDLLLWAERVKAVDLAGPLRWRSALQARVMEKPIGLCVMGMFNHQTHHRGQMHAMLTAAGAAAPVTDLAFMPDEGPWL
jgi:uncharacterized damage-inducible protein DinB